METSERIIKAGTTPNGQRGELIEITHWTPGVAGTRYQTYEVRGEAGTQKIPAEKVETVKAMIRD